MGEGQAGAACGDQPKPAGGGLAASAAACCAGARDCGNLEACPQSSRPPPLLLIRLVADSSPIHRRLMAGRPAEWGGED